MAAIVIAVFIVLCGGSLVWLWLDHKQKSIQHLQRYEKVHELKKEEARTKNNIHRLRKRLEDETQQLQVELSKITRECEEKRELIREASLDADVLDAGFFRVEYDFVQSRAYREELKKNRDKQRALIRLKKAAVCPREWVVDGSAEAGRKMVEEKLKLMLRAFNGECDNYCSRVTYRNGNAMVEKIRKAYDEINKLGAEKQCFLSEELLELKITELKLVFGYNERKEMEREEQRRIRAEQREEEKARREREELQRKAEEEEAALQKALEEAKQQMEAKTDADRAVYEKKIELLQKQLEDAGEMKAKAIAQAQLTKAGHVYVISNIGSFGEDVYKIGLTRRLDPLERVKELGDASVPFPYDVHAMAYSDDAPTLEKKLHAAFDRYRVNKVNPHKEFFKVPLRAIADEMSKENADVTFTLVAEARDYRESQATEPELVLAGEEE